MSQPETTLAIDYRDSPNFTAGRPMLADTIVLHSTRGGQTIGVEARATINWFLNPASQASAHLLVAQDGRITRFVEDENQAWGAGERPGYETGDMMNERALQVELEQPNNSTPFSQIQMERLATVVRDWMREYHIPWNRVMPHEDTPSGQAWGKSDVGRMFNWTRFLLLVED